MDNTLIFLIGFLFFIFGTIIGSFLNVVIVRYNTGKGISGRSCCHSCSKVLTPVNLVPIFSFLLQKGACSTCKSKISIQYPLVEFITGVLFLFSFLFYVSIPGIALSLLIVSLLTIIAVYDFRHGIIPNPFVYTFIGLSFISLFFNVHTLLYMTPSLLTVLSGPILAVPIWLLWLMSKGEWIGLGDAKLFLGVGWFLGSLFGISAVITAFVLSFWVGAFVSILLIAIHKLMRIRKLNLGQKALTIKTEIPFAPFIIFSFLIVYFFGFDLIFLLTP